MSTPYSRRSSSSPLFPDVHIVDDKDKSKAFIGRFQRADGGEIYGIYMRPYAGKDGTYDISNRMLESMYKKYYLSGLWESLKFARVTFWALENDLEINSYTYSRGSRLYDRKILPTGMLEDMDYDSIMWIVNGGDQ
jgi:hypothetical protein